MLDSRYLVIEWEWLEDSLEDSELEKLYEYIERASFDKEEHKYYVVDTQAPYAEDVYKILKRGCYKPPEKPIKLEKGKLLSRLAELSKLEDGEIAQAEAIEAILDYINDDEITRAYCKVPLYDE